MYVYIHICTFSIIILYTHLVYLNPSNLVLKSQFSFVQYQLLKCGTIAGYLRMRHMCIREIGTGISNPGLETDPGPSALTGTVMKLAPILP